MTIAINTRFLLDQRLEGIGWFTYEMVKRLVAKHPNYQFIFFFDRSVHPRFVFADNVTPIVLFPPARHPILFYAWFEWSVRRALKQYQVDLFISPDGFLSLYTDVPTLLVIHDLAYLHFPNQVKYIEQQYYRYFMPRFVRKATRIATVSQYSKQDIHQQYDIPLATIDVVYNGARTSFVPLAVEEQQCIKATYAAGQDYFFYIGAVHPRKNVHRLIAAFDKFKSATNAPMKLLIGGRFAWQTGLVKEAYDQAVHQQDIDFLGYVADEVVPQLMGSAFAFTYISLFEGFGIPLLEAMCCEVPVITANVSSMPEVIGDAGLKVNPLSVEAMVQAMVDLYEQPELTMELVRHARQHRLQFSWELTVERLEESIGKMFG